VLLLEAPSEAAGLSVFADHLSPTTFHYLPGSPRVVRREGRPGVQLLRYRGVNSGGLLLLDVDLSHDPAAIETARAALSQKHGGANLVPVTFREGTVRLVALGVDSAAGGDSAESRTFLVEKVMGSTTPALFGTGRAIFSARLSAEGASLIQQALQDAGLPLAIVYELTFDGLRRARGARASIEFAMAYDFLRSRLRADALIFKADVDAEVEALKRAGLVSITDVDYTGTDPATLAARTEELRAELATIVEATFFRPGASPAAIGGPAVAAGTAVGDAWARGSHARAAFLLRELSQRETGTVTYDLTVSRVAHWTIAPQGALNAIAGTDVAILDVDAEAAGVRPLTVVVPPGADWTGVDAVEVSFQQATSDVGTVVVRPNETEATLSTSAGATSYRTRVLARPEPDALGEPSSEESANQPLLADHLVVDPASIAGRRLLSIELDQAEPAIHATARGVLESVGRTRPFALDAGRPSISVPVWGSGPLVCAFAVELDRLLVASERREVLPSERLLVLSPPAGRQQFIAVELADPMERLETVFVEIEDGTGHRALVKVDSAAPRAAWTGMRAPDAPAPFRWNARTVTKSGRSTETGWRDGAGSLLVVGDTDVQLRTVQLLLVGAPATSIGAELTITVATPPPDIDGRVDVVFEAPFVTTVRLPFQRGSAASPYRVEGRLFLEDGEARLGPVESSDDVCLLSAS
jgi:hypothetical protein